MIIMIWIFIEMIYESMKYLFHVMIEGKIKTHYMFGGMTYWDTVQNW